MNTRATLALSNDMPATTQAPPDPANIPALSDDDLAIEFMFWFRVWRNEENLHGVERLYAIACKEELYRRGIVPGGIADPTLKHGDTYESIAMEIHSIRYGQPGKVVFNFREKEIFITEPQDVILVGANQLTAARWLSDRYGFVLSLLPKPTTRLRE